MFISRKDYDEINARIVELAGQVRDLNEENKCLYNEKKMLNNRNLELQEVIEKVLTLATSNTYNNDKAILGKIKEVINSANVNNF